jgi:hypothetical protein
MLFLLVSAAVGCSPDQITGDAELPSNVPDPSITETPAGALSVYRGTLTTFTRAYGGYGGFIQEAGWLSDELHAPYHGAAIGDPNSSKYPSMIIDSRTLPENGQVASSSSYRMLQSVRSQALQAIGLLTEYVPDSSRALVGHVQAIEGFANIMLADLFCSGIPLSTLDYGGDYTLSPGIPSVQVYERAAALFDSAMTMATDSTRILNLARVGKARALLSLALYDSAAAIAALVPDGYRYVATFDPNVTSSFARGFGSPPFVYWDGGTVSDREGGNGLDYISSHDPRTIADSVGTTSGGLPLWYPKKYTLDGSASVIVADFVEARLIQAEAALHQGNASWLAILNALRTTSTTCTVNAAPSCASTAPAGTGGVAGLPLLVDPGDDAARIDLLFRERAFWLFLTGHRQGDLRRLIRQYGRDQSTVYPVGIFLGVTGQYGDAVNLPIIPEEKQYNPRFGGCIDRSA